MRKIITLTILLFSILFSSSIYGQMAKKTAGTIKNNASFSKQQLRFASKPIVKQKRIINSSRPLAPGDCQIILPGYDVDSSTVLFTDVDGDDVEDGYVVGTNPYDDQQKASYFDFSSALANNYVIGVGIFFYDAQGDDLTKIVPIRVYDGTGGVVGAEIGHVDLTMQTIADSLASPDYYGVPVIFNNLIIPASKKVFISVDMSNLDYYEGDLLAIYSTDWDYLPVNTAWEQWDNGVWYAYSDPNDWDANITMAMVPVIGESLICTQVVPVKLVSFNGNTFGSGNKLEWTVANEINNKGYEIERSSDGVSFAKVGYIASQIQSGNSAGTLQYSFVDNTPATQKTFYRLRQVDMDGKATYSKIVAISRGNVLNAGLVQLYPNPVKNSLNLVVDVPTNQPATVMVMDITGKTLMQKNIFSTGVNQNISFNAASLSKGTYFVQLKGEGSKKTIRFVKE